MMNQKILGVAFLIVGLAVSGCGSNGGGGMAGVTPLSVTQSSNAGDGGGGAGIGLTPLNNAAESIPRSSGVNPDSAGVTRATMNAVPSYDANGELSFTVMYDSNGDGDAATIKTASAPRLGVASQEEVRQSPTVIVEPRPEYQPVCSGCDNSDDFSGRTWNGVMSANLGESDVLFLGFYTDLQPGDPDDADYISIGGWLSSPAEVVRGLREPVSDDLQIGAFAEVSNPFPQTGIMALTGTATYQGDVIGIYTTRAFNGRDAGAGGLLGNVELTADFGDAGGLGSVEGRVYGLQVRGSREGGLLADPSLPWEDAPLQELTLGTAPISDMDGGYFTGVTSGTGRFGASYTGQWGGMFAGTAGANPTSVGGTFGAATEDGSMNFFGAFGAYQQ